MLKNIWHTILGDAAWLEVQDNRRKVYTSAIGLCPILVAAGLLSSGEAQDILVALGALAGVGGNALARRNSWGG